MEIITTRQQLQALAVRLGVRNDWHEPDEQGLTARLDGFDFDNAGFWPMGEAIATQAHLGLGFVNVRRVEQHVVISQVPGGTEHECENCDHVCGCLTGEPQDVAAINLATLLAWACGYER